MQIQAEPGNIGPAIHIHLQSVPLFTMNHVSQIFRYVRYVRYIRLFEANEYNDK